jgi:hypothetical protein
MILEKQKKGINSISNYFVSEKAKKAWEVE